MTDPAPFYPDIADAPEPAEIIFRRAEDGTRLRMGLWPAGPRGMVALFPGRTEVIEKYGRVIRDLAACGFGAAVIDWRGQGLSDRAEGQPLLGDISSFAEYQQDVAVLDALMREACPDAPRMVLAHSMGGCIALRALSEGFAARACAFSAPMWGLRVSAMMRHVTTASRAVLGLARLDRREVPGAGVEFRLWENSFDNNELTSDRDTYAWMQTQVRDTPGLRLGAPSLRWAAAAMAETRALAALPSPDLPAVCGLGSREMIVESAAIRARMADWPRGALVEYDGALHELLMERPEIRTPFLARICELFTAQADPR